MSGSPVPETIDLGDGYRLQRVTVEHADAMARAVGESLDHLRPFMPWADPVNARADVQRRRLADVEQLWAEGTEHQFVLGNPDEAGDRVLGAIGLIHNNRWGIGPDCAEIGYWVHVDWCNRGLATRASRALADAAFGLAGVERVAIVCDAANAASNAVPRKLGFSVDRVVERRPEAPGESGRMQVWLRTHDGGDE